MPQFGNDPPFGEVLDLGDVVGNRTGQPALRDRGHQLLGERLHGRRHGHAGRRVEQQRVLHHGVAVTRRGGSGCATAGESLDGSPFAELCSRCIRRRGIGGQGGRSHQPARRQHDTDLRPGASNTRARGQFGATGAMRSGDSSSGQAAVVSPGGCDGRRPRPPRHSRSGRRDARQVRRSRSAQRTRAARGRSGFDRGSPLERRGGDDRIHGAGGGPFEFATCATRREDLVCGWVRLDRRGGCRLLRVPPERDRARHTVPFAMTRTVGFTSILRPDENQPTVGTPIRCYAFVTGMSHRNAHTNAYLWKLAGALQPPVCFQRNTPRPMNPA